eukprot:TRINITY_DN2436_c0_g1_i5.p1 TRINITY_DN2436_c0_g1~~TRINITY_DN2436_c0_g1_i5.p1  ORF type:complete len:713 (-),score=172.49 TRINITY_DN2436_c0_g1_i5:1884-4022(-)
MAEERDQQFAKTVTNDVIADFLNVQHSVKTWIESVMDVSLNQDLHSDIKNGVILCYLMEEINARAIPKIHSSTSSPFKLKENIDYFLGAIEDYGVPKYRLFFVNELYNKKNMVNVILAIRELGLIANGNGFTPEYQILTVEDPVELDEETSAHLRVLLGRVKTGASKVRKWKKAPGIVRRELSLRAGNNVQLADYEPEFEKFQSYIRGVQGRRDFRKRVRDNAHRIRVVNELLETERVYVQSLKTCLDDIYHPLLEEAKLVENKKKPWITKDIIKDIFSDLNLIYSINSKLYTLIEERIHNWAPHECLADIFIQMVQFLKVYTKYIQNYSNAITLYHKLTIKPKSNFSVFLREIRLERNITHDLPSFLIMPIQRIPRYSMLISDIIKHTWEDHADFVELFKARDAIEDVAMYLNEKQREAENTHALLEIEETLIGAPSLRVAGRRHICDYYLYEKNQERKLYLFNNLIVIGKPDKKDTVKYRTSFEINSFHLDSEDSNIIFRKLDAGEGDKPMLVLRSNDLLILAKIVNDIEEARENEIIRERELKQAQEIATRGEVKFLTAEEAILKRKAEIKEKVSQQEEDDTQTIEDRFRSMIELQLLLEKQVRKNETEEVLEELEEVKEKIEVLKSELDEEELEHMNQLGAQIRKEEATKQRQRNIASKGKRKSTKRLSSFFSGNFSSDKSKSRESSPKATKKKRLSFKSPKKNRISN